MSTVSTCTSLRQIQRLQPDSTGPLTAHTPADCPRYTANCGEEGGNSQAYTGRHRSPLVCVSVRVRKSVCACLPQETTTSIEHTHHNGHRYANARNMHLKLRTCTSYGNVWTHVSAVNEVIVPHYTHDKRYVIYSPTNIKHTQQCDLHTWRHTNKSNAYFLKHTPQVFCLNVIHVKVSTPMYVYLRQGAQSGEYWVRQRFQFVVVKANLPVGRRDETVNRAHV